VHSKKNYFSFGFFLSSLYLCTLLEEV